MILCAFFGLVTGAYGRELTFALGVLCKRGIGTAEGAGSEVFEWRKFPLPFHRLTVYRSLFSDSVFSTFSELSVTAIVVTFTPGPNIGVTAGSRVQYFLR